MYQWLSYYRQYSITNFTTAGYQTYVILVSEQV